MKYLIFDDDIKEATFLALAQVERMREIRRRVAEAVAQISPDDRRLREEVEEQTMRILTRRNSTLRRDVEGRR